MYFLTRTQGLFETSSCYAWALGRLDVVSGPLVQTPLLVISNLWPRESPCCLNVVLDMDLFRDFLTDWEARSQSHCSGIAPYLSGCFYHTLLSLWSFSISPKERGQEDQKHLNLASCNSSSWSLKLLLLASGRLFPSCAAETFFMSYLFYSKTYVQNFIF